MITSMSRTHPEFLIEFGEFTILFSHVEHNIKEFIGILLNDKDRKSGEIMTADAPFKVLYHNLMSLYRYRVQDNSRIKKLENILLELDRINTLRNELIHGVWGFSNTGIIQSNMKAKFSKGLHVKITPHQTKSLHNLTGELFGANLHLLVIQDEYTAGLSPN
jgi:hypothetical protein